MHILRSEHARVFLDTLVVGLVVPPVHRFPQIATRQFPYCTTVADDNLVSEIEHIVVFGPDRAVLVDNTLPVLIQSPPGFSSFGVYSLVLQFVE